MSSYRVVPVSPTPVLFGESPFWDHRSQKLVFIDCFGKAINTFDPSTGKQEEKSVKSAWGLPPAGGIVSWQCLAVPFASTPSKFLIQSSNGDLTQFDWELETSIGIRKETLEHGENGMRLYSDGKCDAKGRFWTGYYDVRPTKDFNLGNIPKDQGKIINYMKSGDSVIKSSIGSGFDVPNGLAWNPANDKLFWNDLLGKVIFVYDFDLENGTVGNKRTFFEFGKYKELDGSMPDGLALDLNGHLWIACWKGSCVIKVDGETGKLLQKVPIPVTNTTALIFGGAKYEKLFVTTTSVELDLNPVKGEPDAGKLFQITSDKDNSVRGFEQFFFNF